MTCWIQQSVSPKQVVGFTCVFNSGVDQLIRKSSVGHDDYEVERLNQDLMLEAARKNDASAVSQHLGHLVRTVGLCSCRPG